MVRTKMANRKQSYHNVMPQITEKTMGRAAKKKKLTNKQKKTKKSKAAIKDFSTRNEHIEVDNNIFNEDNPKEVENNAIQTEVNSENNDAQIEENPQVTEDSATQSGGDSDYEVTESEGLSQDAGETLVVRRKTRGPTKTMGRTAKKQKLTNKQKKTKKSKAAIKDFSTRNEHTEVDNDTFNEDNPKEVENNVIQTEVNSENNDAEIEENPKVTEDNATQSGGDSDYEATESEGLSQDAGGTLVVRRKARGPTKVIGPPSDPMSRIEVQFNAEGEPIGTGSVKLSSFLGPLVRERVPITLSDWRLLSEELKAVLWESIQARFKLDEEWQKVIIFQQMGCIWRGSKSRLVRQIINAKTEEKRLQLRPNNIEITEWKKFIEYKTSSNFKAKSEKFKAIKRNQTPHTCGRRGLARLAEDLREHSVDPSSVSRLQVWIKSRTRKDGEPVSTTVADTIEKLKRMESESESSSAANIKEDTVSQVLGQDRPGQLRAMGRGMTLKKVTSPWTRAKQVVECQNRISELEETIHMLMKNQREESWREAQTLQMSKYDQVSDKCDLLDWSGTDEIVAEGRVVSSDPNEPVHKIPLGPNAMKILIDSSKKSDAFLWRPTHSLMHIGDAEDEIVAWPSSRVVLRMTEHFQNGESVSKTNSTHQKCKLYDWSGNEELVAEGRLYSSDPKQLVNDMPLGPFAMAVWIDDPKKHDAFLWRPTAGMTCVGEAVGAIVAWPESKVTVEMVKTATTLPVVDVVAPLVSKTSSSTYHICKLYDWSGGEELVAEGRLYSSDPKQLVNDIPLGPFAMAIWIDDSKKQDAFLWRPTAGMTCVGEAVGAIVAWPKSKVTIEKVDVAATSPVGKTSSSSYHICKLYDWSGSEELVAEGRLYSSDPKLHVNDIPLGPFAMAVWIDDSKKQDAFLWRPTADMTCVGEALGAIVAWPKSKVTIEKIDTTATSPVGKTSITYHKCKLYDWSGGEELVAEGRLYSSDPKQLVNGIPLGPFAAVVWIDDPKKRDAFLWRPSAGMTCVGEAVGAKVAWPEAKVVVEKADTAPSSPMVNVATSPVSKTSITYHKCKLYDWSGGEELVAEGRLYSNDPKQIVNDIPIGPFAMAVWIDDPKKQDAFLWRPTAGMTCVGEAIGTVVAWPESKTAVEKTAYSAPKNKRKFTDLCGTNVVAEGRVPPEDPNALVHYVPLERNAVDVLVELQKSQSH